MPRLRRRVEDLDAPLRQILRVGALELVEQRGEQLLPWFAVCSGLLPSGVGLCAVAAAMVQQLA